MDSDVHTFPDLEEASRALAETLSRQICLEVEREGRCTLVLSGGNTPRPLYECLAVEFADAIPWTDVHVFWGDERYVPHTDDASNLRMAREALLDHVPIPDANVHPMPTGFVDPGEATQDYEDSLRAFFFDEPWPAFDIVLLGLGSDGHTASLFPGSRALSERTRWVVPVENREIDPPRRLTLTLPVLNHAARAHFLVAGMEKATAVLRARNQPPDAVHCPASAVRPSIGTLTWWLDEEAAGEQG